MAALLVGMSVAAVLMTAAMPAWKQMVRREQETELVFRGQQYVRAIELFQKKSGPGVLPPSIDVLLSGRFLRKKYTDPVTNRDFDLLSPTQAAGQGSAAAGGTTGGGATGRGSQPSTPPPSQPATMGSLIGAQDSRGAVGGIIGVASKSKAASIRIYNGRTHYNEWQFFYQPPAQPGGAGAPGGPAGQRGNGPGQGTPRGGAPFGTGQDGRAGPGRGNAPQGSPRGGSAPPAVPSPFQPRR